MSNRGPSSALRTSIQTAGETFTTQTPKAQDLPKSPKMRARLARASSSLDITASFEAFRPFEETTPERESEKAGNLGSPPATEVEISSCYRSSTQTNDEDDSAAEAIPPSHEDDMTASKTPPEPPSTGEASHSESHPEAKSDGASDDDGSFAKTFHGGIHGAYNTSCRELNALFGEIRLEGLCSQTKRAVSQCMLLHLLAISTDDPGTYRGCIRRALHICQTMDDRTIAENIWKKTFHITDEMDEDFCRGSNSPVIRESDHGSPKPLDTITEEEDNTIDSPEKLSCPSVPSSRSAPNPNIDDKNIPEAVHRANTNEPFPVFEEDQTDAAYSEFIAELQADALRRKEATDRHITSLDLELWRRTHATEQYIADLAADVAQRRRATEQYLADLVRKTASTNKEGLGVARD